MRHLNTFKLKNEMKVWTTERIISNVAVKHTRLGHQRTRAVAILKDREPKVWEGSSEFRNPGLTGRHQSRVSWSTGTGWGHTEARVGEHSNLWGFTILLLFRNYLLDMVVHARSEVWTHLDTEPVLDSETKQTNSQADTTADWGPAETGSIKTDGVQGSLCVL